MSFSVYKAFNKLQGTMWVFYITKRGKKKAKPEHGRKMARKSDIKRRLHINFPSMQQVHIYLSSLHKKVKKKKSVRVYLCCTQCSCFCCLLLLAKSHPAATWGQQSVP